MGSFFIDLLSFDHEVAVYEKDAKRLRFTYNCYRFTKMEEVEMFRPELVINAVTVKYTIPAFEELLPHLSKDCIISDIASVKTGLQEFYDKSGFRYVSTHPMFGPTFANLNQLSEEVATPEHVELALKYGIDVLWVGARTSANPFAMQALADSLQGVDVPVLVKNPVNPDLELWIGALQRINQAGIKRLGAIHRGFSSFDKKIYRNLPMWQIPIELHRRIPQLPIICDPSHIGGRRDLIAPLCQQAMDLGFDGLIVESHCSPDDAWSDAKQQVTPDILDYILSLLVVRDEHYSTEGLHQLRGQIDECDNQLMDLLAKRMRVCREIGTYKKEHNMTIVQTNRYNEILEKRGAQASLCGMSPEFAAQIFEHIHEESVRQQLEILNQK